MAKYESGLKKIKDVLDNCTRPLIFFDDDCDGLMSFVLFYRYVGEGKGVIIKSTPHITQDYAKKVEEYQPDAVFVLDVAEVDQEFIDKVKVKVVVLDHHDLVDISGHNLVYFNPKQYEKDANQPTSYWCYRIVKDRMMADKKSDEKKADEKKLDDKKIDEKKSDEKKLDYTKIEDKNADEKQIDDKIDINDVFLWLGTLGSVSDWYIPSYYDEFKKKYPQYVVDKEGNEPKDVGDILYKTKLGVMWHLISFILKGQTKDVTSAINIMIKVNHPDEILKQQSSRGKLLYKRYKQLDLEYQKLLVSAEKNKDDEIILFKYPSSAMSFTCEISNELLYKYPGKLIVIARQKGDEMKVSLRSTKIDLPRALESSFVGISGYGGGHPRASGACIKIDDFDKFIENMKDYIKKNE